MNKHFHFLFFSFQLLLASCSTTRHLPEGELLYTGTRAVEVTAASPSTLSDTAVAAAKVAFVAPPNNALLGSSRLRTPLPIGLWAYNAFADDTTRLGRWLFRTFAAQPIYLSTVNPALRCRVAENTLHDYGYFNSRATHHVDTLASTRKARLTYHLHLGPAWHYGRVEYRGFPGPMDSLIRATWDERLVRETRQLSYATLSGERSRLTNIFHDHGYYYLRPDMIILLADTTISPHEAQIRIEPHAALPSYATKPWYIGKVNVEIMKSEKLKVKSDHPVGDTSLRPALNSSFFTLNSSLIPGSLYSPTTHEATLQRFYRLGVVRGASIDYTPRDSLHLTDTLDVAIRILLNPPYEFALETHLTAKADGLIGPGIEATLTRNNLLRRADILGLRLKGSYEWPTSRHHTASRSFELGAEATLSVPTLPRVKSEKIKDESGHPTRGKSKYTTFNSPLTSFNFHLDWLRRGGYFSMFALGGDLTYTLVPSATIQHRITPLSLAYNTLGGTTALFDSLMTANPAIALSFRDQFVPSATYALTLQSSHAHHHSSVLFTLTSAGALASLLPTALKPDALAQYLKTYGEYVHHLRLHPRHTLAMRLVAGLIYAYGDDRSIPFREQFHVGGASDLRAFSLRSVGPGSYHSTGREAWTEHVGNLKLGMNVEWRFPLVGSLSGALFADMGNVWLLRPDASRPGGTLQWETLGRDLALGTGFGLRYNLRLVLLRCDVGIPIHAPYATERRGYYNIPHPERSLCLHLGVGYPF